LHLLGKLFDLIAGMLTVAVITFASLVMMVLIVLVLTADRIYPDNRDNDREE
jgi:hypothetical protein